MNIEQLNKSQIVLLTLLVSFVTSIATGIVTVSLMDQAPPVIAQTVNRIVERTIETVVPASQTASTASSQNAVIVKESELISQAIAKITPSIVRLYASTSLDAPFLGLGIVTHSNGSIVSDASLFTSSEAAIALSDGTRIKVVVSSQNEIAGTVFLQATSTEEMNIAWKPAAVSANSPILGETIVMLSGKSIARVEDGIVTALIPTGTEEAQGLVIDTSISSDFIIAGAPLLNMAGEIVGVSTGVARTSSLKGFIASSVLVKQSEENAEEEKSGTQ